MVRPDFTATIGFFIATRRAIRLNLRGLPIDSRYSRTTSVSSSSSQNCRRSVPDTSARLPALTNDDRPRPRRSTLSRIATPRAPDWQKNPTRPRGGISGDREAFIDSLGRVLITPRQFGPTSRRP